MPRWLRFLLCFFGLATRPETTSDRVVVPPREPRRHYPVVGLRLHAGQGRPPPLGWKASHPSTITRFKAEVTCTNGHAISLRDHGVEADGRVVPSIVCKTPGCDFHEIVRLEGWSAGRLPAHQAAAFCQLH